MPEKREDVKIYNAVTGKWEKPVEADKDAVAMHEAIAEGGPLPSDRTEEELRQLEPGMAEPVITAGTLSGSVAPALAPATARGATP